MLRTGNDRFVRVRNQRQAPSWIYNGHTGNKLVN